MKKFVLIVFLIFSGIIYGQVGISMTLKTTENFGTDISNTQGSTATNLPAFWKIDNPDYLPAVRTVGSYFDDNIMTTVPLASGDLVPVGTPPTSTIDYFFTTATADKALGGWLRAANTSINIYTQLKNTGSTNIKRLFVKYNVEKYKRGKYPGGYSIIMYHSTDGVNWTQSGSDFKTNYSADPTYTGYDYGPGITTPVSGTIDVEIEPGQLFYLAWNYSPTTGEGPTLTGGTTRIQQIQALAIDDVEITPYGLPIVETNAITDTTINSVVFKSHLITDGINSNYNGSAPYFDFNFISEKGICWSTEPNPTIESNKIMNTEYISLFDNTLTNIDPSQIYYIRTYATNRNGIYSSVPPLYTGYGEQKILKIAPKANLGTDLNNNSFTSSWSLPGATSYRLDVATSNNFETDCIEGYTNLSVSSTSQEITGLTAGQTYYYRVRAVDANGKISFNSDTIRVTTLGNNGNNGIINNTGNQNITIGNGTGIGEIQFGNITQGGNILVNHYNNPPTNYGTSLPAQVSNYRWVIEPNNNLVINEETGYKLRFEVSSCPGITEYANEATTTVKLYKRSNPGMGDFTDCGFLVYYNNGSVNNQNDDYLLSQLITTGFSEFVFGSESAFPVELSSFSAVKSVNKVILNWVTATELNNNCFEIERKISENNWEKIGTVAGFGNSNSIKEYNFTDNQISLSGKYVYRLKQIDNDGKFTYSNVIEVLVEAPKEFELVQNYPNPFNPTTTISFSLPMAAKVIVKVFDVLGREVATLANQDFESGVFNLQFNAASLSSGTYFYSVNAEGIDGNRFHSVKKMILAK